LGHYITTVEWFPEANGPVGGGLTYCRRSPIDARGIRLSTGFGIPSCVLSLAITVEVHRREEGKLLYTEDLWWNYGNGHPVCFKSQESTFVVSSKLLLWSAILMEMKTIKRKASEPCINVATLEATPAQCQQSKKTHAYLPEPTENTKPRLFQTTIPCKAWEKDVERCDTPSPVCVTTPIPQCRVAIRPATTNLP
jgi:hypothetical protein